MANMWMVRGNGGRLYDAFREREVVGIGWSQIAIRTVMADAQYHTEWADEDMALAHKVQWQAQELPHNHLSERHKDDRALIEHYRHRCRNQAHRAPQAPVLARLTGKEAYP